MCGRSNLSSPDGEEGCFFPCTCASLAPNLWGLLTVRLSHKEMEKRGARPHRTVCRTSCPSPLGFRIVKQSPAVPALSLSNKVVYYKWIGQLWLEPQSSENLSANLVWVSSCSEIWNEADFMGFQVLLKMFQPALVSSCCFFSFLPLMCLWYFKLNMPQIKC